MSFFVATCRVLLKDDSRVMNMARSQLSLDSNEVTIFTDNEHNEIPQFLYSRVLFTDVQRVVNYPIVFLFTLSVIILILK